MYYSITVGYELETMDKEGNPKIKKVKYLVEAESVEEASIVMGHYLAEDRRGSKVISVVEDKTEDVISQELKPKYYKKLATT
jgi:hypothetical protein